MKFWLLFFMVYVLGVLIGFGFILHAWQVTLVQVLEVYCGLLMGIPSPRRLQRVLAMVFVGTITFLLVHALLH